MRMSQTSAQLQLVLPTTYYMQIKIKIKIKIGYKAAAVLSLSQFLWQFATLGSAISFSHFKMAATHHQDGVACDYCVININ